MTIPSMPEIPMERMPFSVDLVKTPTPPQPFVAEIPKMNNSFVIHNKKYLKEFIQRKKLIPYQCAICGLSEWQNEPLRLELDSYNGIYSNTNLNNLRFLCPNCYSQVGYNN